MFALPRASSTLAFGLSLFFILSTASAVDIPGDFNGDGRMDAILQPLTATQPGAIVLQDGTGNLSVFAQQWDAGYLGLDWSAADSTLTTADLNGDGLDDVIMQPNTAGQTAAVLITDPSIQLLQISQVLPAGSLGLDWSSAANVITAGDFDGDRRKELLLQSTTNNGPAVMVHADATGQLVVVTQQFPDGFLGRHWDAHDETFYVGDFNGDGRQDLLVQSHDNGNGESTYALLLADASGNFSSIFQTWNDKDLGADWNRANHKIVIADVNGDGIADIELLSTSNGDNYLFTGSAQGLFTQPAAHWTGNQPMPNPSSTGTQSSTSSSSISVMPSGTVTTDILTGPTNPEPNPVIPRDGGGTGTGTGSSSITPGSSQIMTVNTVGTMAGSGGVSGGTATYSIPIAVPPGIKGVQPSISLSYSSRGGDGDMGMGWSLNAGSQIHRCPAILALDGYSNGVSYTAGDRLCLDGQHLVYVSGGSGYGTDGAVYRTDLDSFSQVTEVGDISSATSHFTVLTKSGQTMRYGWGSNIGSSPNAVFTPAGAPAPLAWALGLEMDPHHNSIIYYYSTFGSGEYLLTSINYTGSAANVVGTREVDFGYSPRGDVSNQYLAGGLTQQTQLLTSITTSENGTYIRTYSVEYTTSNATNRSLVAGVQECAGAGADKECLPETTFTWHQPARHFNAPSAIDASDGCADINTMPGSTSISTVGDVNGDGYKDLIASNNCDTTIYLMGPGGLPAGGTGISVGSQFQYNTVMPYTVDIDGDGTADLIGLAKNTSVIGYSRYDAASGFTGIKALKTEDGTTIPYSRVVGVKDVDGDGLPDIVVVMPDPNPNRPNYHMLAVYLNTTQPCSTLGCHPTVTFSATPTLIFTVADAPGQPSPSIGATSIDDMDGNGLPDFTMSYYTSDGVQHNWWVFPENSGGSLTFTFVNQRNDGRTAAAWAATRMDINGDGLPDMVYECGGNNGTDLCYALNTGKTVAGSLFGPEVDTGVQDWRNGDQEAMGGSLTADLDNDGTQEIIYPYALLAEYCEKNVYYAGETFDECMYSTSHTLPSYVDRSIYQYAEIKFSWGQLSSGSSGYVPSLIVTGIQAQAQVAAAIDLQGDGLTGIVSPFTKEFIDGYFIPAAGYTRPIGPHVASNSNSTGQGKNAAPDLMLSATNGLQHTESWDYYPLTTSAASNNLPVYASMNPVDNSQVGGSYFYFSSSMYVVGDYKADNGVGGTSIHDFHYGQAIYQSQGLGFQGFRTVVDDDMTSGARTVQVYHQHFPLSGLLQESWTTTLADGLDLSDPNPAMGANAVDHVITSVACNVGQGAPWLNTPTNGIYNVDGINCKSGMDAKTYFPFLAQSVDTKYDVTTHDTLSTVTTTYCVQGGNGWCQSGTGYDIYGNLLMSKTVVADSSGTYTSSIQNTYNPSPNLTTWWIDRLDEKAATVQTSYVGQPTGAQLTRTTDYGYDVYRDLTDVKAEADGDSSHLIETQYGYATGELGNVTSVTVSGGSGTIGVGTAITPRVTTTTYSTGADAHYFVATVSDPQGLTTSYATDARFGSPTSITAPDGVVTAKSYDPFGRIVSTKVGSLPAQTTQYVATAGDGRCDSTTASSTYYVLVNQNGYPSHYTCHDTLDRTVRAATESFSIGSELVYQDTGYDSRGRVAKVSEPHFASQPAIWNVNAYYPDILGRLEVHTDAKGVKTAYTYNDLVTDIETTTPNDPLNSGYDRVDEEQKNSLGKLLTVINAKGAAEQASTSYQYDSDGNPITITAADGTAITAVYDILGHKTDVTDPDQGHTGYTYDVIGELLTQTDAKGQTLTMTYDKDGRIYTKNSPEGITSWCYDGAVYQSAASACNTASLTAAAGKLTSVGQSWQLYQENYVYDSMGRIKTDDEVIAGTDYDTDTSYDSYGRVDVVTYPDSIADAIPVANAGTIQYVAPNKSVTLDASASSDADSGPQPLAFQWSQTAGPAVNLSSSTAVNPTFTTGSSLGTTYSFQLTADDGLAAGKDNVSVVVPAAPTAPITVTDDGDTNHDGSYNVSWSTVSVTGTTMMYYLEEAGGTATGPTATWKQVCSTSGTSCPVSHPDNSYYYYWYRVRTQDFVNGTALAYSAYSTYDSINVVVTPHAPASISPISAAATGPYEVTWVSGGGRTTFYQLDMTPYGGTATLIYQGANTYYIVPAQAQGPYHFKVRACNESPTSLLTECSAYTGGATVTWSISGGGTGCPSCQPQAPVVPQSMTTGAPSAGTIGMAQPVETESQWGSMASSHMDTEATTPAPAISHRSDVPAGQRLSLAASAVQVHTKHARPTFAPPVYKAWATAHLQQAAGTTGVVRFAVAHLYTANGYLSGLASAVDNNRVYWHVNPTTSGADPVTGNYSEYGMDARGNVVDSTYGTGGTYTYSALMSHASYDPNTGYLKGQVTTDSAGTTTYQNWAYQWYAIGNLYSRQANPTLDNANALSETFSYDLHNRVLSSAVTNAAGSPTPVTQAYDMVGDISCKSDVTGSACSPGSTAYVYGGTSGGPHAVTAAGSNVYAYDADGNMTSRSVTVNAVASSQTITWNSDNLPTCIDASGGTCTGGSNYSAFSYAPDKHRYQQVAMNGGSSETTLYLGGMEIVTDSTGTTYRHTLTAYGKPVYQETLSTTSTGGPKEKRRYLLTDHLGSVDAVVNDFEGLMETRESFDAFGQRRDAGSWNGPMSQSALAYAREMTHRGFTHHEHLDNLAGLIDMNGRLEDPVTGRMLSVDPVYQAPSNSQSINPYSYVMNNPLSLTDPSGYESAAASPLESTVGENGGSGPNVTAASQTSSCGSGEGVSSCAGSLQNGQTANIVDGSGNVIGTVGKDSSGNLLVSAGNGSNFGQTPQFSTTISGNTVTTSNGAITAQMTLSPSANETSGSASQLAPSHTSLMVVGSNAFVADVNKVAAKSAGIGMKPGESIFDELKDGDKNVVITHDSYDHIEGDDKQIDVFWNEKSGIYIRKAEVGPNSSLSEYQSPALGLIHELGHAYQYSVEHQTGTLDESEVIGGIETRWADKYSEPIRVSHGGDEREDTDLFDHTVVHHEPN